MYLRLQHTESDGVDENATFAPSKPLNVSKRVAARALGSTLNARTATQFEKALRVPGKAVFVCNHQSIRFRELLELADDVLDCSAIDVHKNCSASP